MRIMKNTLEFNLKPICRDICKAGEKSIAFLRSHGFSEDTVQSQINILNGLIANGLKYAGFSPSATEIIVRLQVDKRHYTIEVANPIDETGRRRLKQLDRPSNSSGAIRIRTRPIQSNAPKLALTPLTPKRMT